MKIGVYLESSPSCGGTYQYNRLIVDALSEMAASGYQIMAFYGESHWKEYLTSKAIECKAAIPTWYSRALPSLWRRLKLPLTLWREIASYFHPIANAMKKENCDLWIFPSQDALAYWMPVPALATIHDLMHRYETRFPEVGAQDEYTKREFHYKNTCQFAKGILVDSALGKEHVEQCYFEGEKCHVLPYIAARELTTIFSPHFDQKYQLPQKYLFYPAQFWAHKNHKNLLQAFAKCKKQNPDLELVLVGSKKNGYNDVLLLIKELRLTEAVHILGLVDNEDIPELYRRARALVMPTFFGPTNIPPLEAFALQCPVGISGIYGMNEQLGEAALYFDPESISDIADKMNQLWNDDALCKTLIENGNKKNEQLNFNNFTLTLQNIIEGIFSKERTC